MANQARRLKALEERIGPAEAAELFIVRIYSADPARDLSDAEYESAVAEWKARHPLPPGYTLLMVAKEADGSIYCGPTGGRNIPQKGKNSRQEKSQWHG